MISLLEKLALAFHFDKNESVAQSPHNQSRFKAGTITNSTISIQQNAQQALPDETQKLVIALRNQWLFSNDGISPARMAGLEWGNGEREWVNEQLAARNIEFRV